eukprot:m.33249 g.33249  ORF g.33249 m.33249 type:complete len:795 (+) comp8507_c0_seq1:292-2676(+)
MGCCQSSSQNFDNDVVQDPQGLERRLSRRSSNRSVLGLAMNSSFLVEGPKEEEKLDKAISMLRSVGVLTAHKLVLDLKKEEISRSLVDLKLAHSILVPLAEEIQDIENNLDILMAVCKASKDVVSRSAILALEEIKTDWDALELLPFMGARLLFSHMDPHSTVRIQAVEEVNLQYFQKQQELFAHEGREINMLLNECEGVYQDLSKESLSEIANELQILLREADTETVHAFSVDGHPQQTPLEDSGVGLDDDDSTGSRRMVEMLVDNYKTAAKGLNNFGVSVIKAVSSRNYKWKMNSRKSESWLHEAAYVRGGCEFARILDFVSGTFVCKQLDDVIELLKEIGVRQARQEIVVLSMKDYMTHEGNMFGEGKYRQIELQVVLEVTDIIVTIVIELAAFSKITAKCDEGLHSDNQVFLLSHPLTYCVYGVTSDQVFERIENGCAREIHLDGCQVESAFFRNLVTATIAGSLVQVFSMQDCIIAEGDKESIGNNIGSLLRDHHQLRILRLSYAQLGVHGCEPITEGLRQSANLRVLDLASNAITEECVSALATAIRDNDLLHSLNLAGNILGPTCGKLLQNLLHHGNLNELNLSRNKLASAGAIALAEALEANTTLVCLKLSENEIDEKGGLALGKALRSNKSLAELDLEQNDLGSEGTTGILEGMRENKHLQTLNLNSNGLGSACWDSIIACITDNESLAHIQLGNNMLGMESGIEGLRDALQQNKTLLSISMTGTHLSDHNVMNIAEGLRLNRSIVEFDLRENQFSSQWKIVFQDINNSKSRNVVKFHIDLNHEE